MYRIPIFEIWPELDVAGFVKKGRMPEPKSGTSLILNQHVVSSDVRPCIYAVIKDSWFTVLDLGLDNPG